MMNDYNTSYDYDNYETNEEQDFTSPYHPKENSTGSKNKVAGGHLLTIIQISVCSVVLIVVTLLKVFGGSAYTQVKNWYVQNVNNSIVAQEQLNTIKESFVHMFPSDSSSQPNSNTESTNSQTVKETRVLVSTSTAATTHSVNSQVPVSLSVFLTPPVQNGTITSAFGWRNEKLHKGIDIAAPLGTKIYSALPGKVESCTQNSTYGNYLVIDHGNDIKTLYAHCSSILVKSGDTIKYGQQIACMGSTGDSTGPHLHFELLIHQINYDPQPMLKARYL